MHNISMPCFWPSEIDFLALLAILKTGGLPVDYLWVLCQRNLHDYTLWYAVCFLSFFFSFSFNLPVRHLQSPVLILEQRSCCCIRGAALCCICPQFLLSLGLFAHLVCSKRRKRKALTITKVTLQLWKRALMNGPKQKPHLATSVHALKYLLQRYHFQLEQIGQQRKKFMRLCTFL